MDVAGLPVGVGGRGELVVERVPVLPLTSVLASSGKVHAVGDGAELLDLLGGARLLADELVAGDAEDGEAPLAVGLLEARPVRRTAG